MITAISNNTLTTQQQLLQNIFNAYYLLTRANNEGISSWHETNARSTLATEIAKLDINKFHFARLVEYSTTTAKLLLHELDRESIDGTSSGWTTPYGVDLSDEAYADDFRSYYIDSLCHLYLSIVYNALNGTDATSIANLGLDEYGLSKTNLDGLYTGYQEYVAGDDGDIQVEVAGADTGDVFTSVAHGLQNGDLIKFIEDGVSGAVPTGITAGVPYFVVNKTDDTFQVSTTSGGSAVTLTADSVATIYFVNMTQQSLARYTRAVSFAWAFKTYADYLAYENISGNSLFFEVTRD